MKYKMKTMLMIWASVMILVCFGRMDVLAVEQPKVQANVEQEGDRPHVHNWEYKPEMDASCTQYGNIAYYYCECGRYFLDEARTIRTDLYSLITRTEHSLVQDKNLERWFCTDCGQHFIDKNNTQTNDSITAHVVTGYQEIEDELYLYDTKGYRYTGEYTLCDEVCLFENGQFVRSKTAKLMDAGIMGERIEYVIYADGTLKLEGRGATYDFPNNADRPFRDYLNEIKKIIIGENITQIGLYALAGTDTRSILFQGTSKLSQIRSNAFCENKALTEVILPESVIYIRNMAFGNCSALEKIYLNTGIEDLHKNAFQESDRVTCFVFESSIAHEYALRENRPFEVIREMPNEKVYGIVEKDGVLYYYQDVEPYYAGLVLIDGNYYYARSNGQLVVNCKYWITKTNNLLPAAEYVFGEDGRIIIESENSELFMDSIIKTEDALYYYRNGAPYYAGLLEYEGEYYYVQYDGKLATDSTQFITKNMDLIAEKNLSDTNIYTLFEDRYEFDEEGKLIRAK